MNYYKVLYRHINGTLYSAGNLPTPFRVKYDLGKNVVSEFEGGKLFVFANEDKAYKFAKNQHYRRPKPSLFLHTEVWEVKVTNPEPIFKLPPLWEYVWDDETDENSQRHIQRLKDNMASYWQKKSQEYEVYTIEDVHSVDSIQLLRHITSI